MTTNVAEKLERLESSFAPILAFVPSTCAVQLNEHPDGAVAPSIAMDLKLSVRDTVRAADDRLLNKIEWSISVYRGPVANERVIANGAIGMLNYHPASEGSEYKIPEGCAIWAHVQPESFDLLSTLALAGRLPSAILVHAGGLRYGWEPDGSAKVWDVDTTKNAFVKQVEVSIGITGQVEQDDLVEQEHRPVDVSDLRSLEQNVAAAIAARVQQVITRLGWILAAVAVIAAFVIFRAF